MTDNLIRFPCPKCGKRLKASPDAVGSSATCTRCGEKLLVPDAAATTEPPGAEPADVPWYAAPQSPPKPAEVPWFAAADPLPVKPAPTALPVARPVRRPVPAEAEPARDHRLWLLAGAGLVVVLGMG